MNTNNLSNLNFGNKIFFKNFFPKFNLVKKIPPEVDIIIIGVSKTENNEYHFPFQNLLSQQLQNQIIPQLKILNFSAKHSSKISLIINIDNITKHILVIGLGKLNQLKNSPKNAEIIKQAVGTAARTVKHFKKISSSFITLSEIDLAATVEGFMLGYYQYNSQQAEPEPLNIALAVDNISKSRYDILNSAIIISQSVLLTRHWVNTPPNILYPNEFAEQAAKLAQDFNINAEIYNETQLTEKGFGGILAVGQGSARKPRLLILNYSPSLAEKSTQVPKIALVGKGITFDSGGISIKPANGMELMTSDMAGAATVIAVILAAARLKLPVNLTVIAPLAENLPSGTAQRPGDVIKQYGGKKVQVINTDAEGRLVLADGIVKALEYQPDYLIDIATLTGAQMIALGLKTFAVMGNKKFSKQFSKIARETGEPAWSMPFPEDLLTSLDNTEVAEFNNHSNSSYGGMLVAGIFLKKFIPNYVKWAHLDIAGPAYNRNEAYGYTPKGGTGVAVRSLIETLKRLVKYK